MTRRAGTVTALPARFSLPRGGVDGRRPAALFSRATIGSTRAVVGPGGVAGAAPPLERGVEETRRAAPTRGKAFPHENEIMRYYVQKSGETGSEKLSLLYSSHCLVDQYIPINRA